jgi:hypothetical protein
MGNKENFGVRGRRGKLAGEGSLKNSGNGKVHLFELKMSLYENCSHARARRVRVSYRCLGERVGVNYCKYINTSVTCSLRAPIPAEHRTAHHC